jgi:hypothetical protein
MTSQAKRVPLPSFGSYVVPQYTVISTIQKTNKSDVIAFGRSGLYHPARLRNGCVLAAKQNRHHEGIIDPQYGALTSPAHVNDYVAREQLFQLFHKGPSKAGGSLGLFCPENMNRLKLIPDCFVKLLICAEEFMDSVCAWHPSRFIKKVLAQLSFCF